MTEFLLARIAEDEETASAAVTEVYSSPGESGWHARGYDYEGIGVCGRPDDGNADYYTATTSQITRWSPTRVAAECEVKRGLIELHSWMGPVTGDPSPDDPRYCVVCISGNRPEDWPCRTLRLLTLPYSDHPNYRDEWKP